MEVVCTQLTNNIERRIWVNELNWGTYSYTSSFSFDTVIMYTSIESDKVLGAIREALDTKPNHSLSTNRLVKRI